MEELTFEQFELFGRETTDNGSRDADESWAFGVLPSCVPRWMNPHLVSTDLPMGVVQDNIIDLTEEDEEEDEHKPGPSNANTQKCPREADAPSVAPERKKRLVAIVTPIIMVEDAVDDGDRERLNNDQLRAETPLNEWETASWTSECSDDLQPLAFQEPVEEEEPEFQEPVEEEETESLPDYRQNDDVNERSDALSEEMINRQDSLHEELINRQDAFFNKLLNRQDSLHEELINRQAAFFNKLINRMDAQDVRGHEQ
ncbi:uncharacterized protein LOC107725335 [Sinocyclocheilus rhinocerous]|uniref:uncharacterized protein LOC107725335 n=1 Tax=Sinocyclocheilus rhinocerous TaxID=307959 RepID=UPI0007B9A904|nr:PREDICTED: uncharacterized protein LOC107725335 [Sinocyclocheilus rhinocerous]